VYETERDRQRERQRESETDRERERGEREREKVCVTQHANESYLSHQLSAPLFAPDASLRSKCV
jgi:hypothetical protein